MDTILALNKGFNFFGITIYFYAFCILGGALIALFLSNYRARENGFPWDTFNSIFIVALPSGIIGARIWYVIAEWSKFQNDLASIFAFRDGGLAIQGGVIFGAAAGILFAYYRRKDMNLLQCADYAVPTILIAQAIGRWGNFINQEVYGQIVSTSSWWLPGFIEDQMIINNAFRVPLFLLEGVVNLAGYVLLTRVIPTLFGKFYKHGDTTFAYFTYYGLVRLILEPVRDKTFNMGISGDGTGSMNAVWMAIAFIAAGVIAIVINHLVCWKLAQKKQENKPETVK